MAPRPSPLPGPASHSADPRTLTPIRSTRRMRGIVPKRPHRCAARLHSRRPLKPARPAPPHVPATEPRTARNSLWRQFNRAASTRNVFSVAARYRTDSPSPPGQAPWALIDDVRPRESPPTATGFRNHSIENLTCRLCDGHERLAIPPIYGSQEVLDRAAVVREAWRMATRYLRGVAAAAAALPVHCGYPGWLHTS